MKTALLFFFIMVNGSFVTQPDTISDPKKFQKTEIIYSAPVESNNEYTKAEAEKAKYRNLIIQELDTLDSIAQGKIILTPRQ